MSPIRFDRLQLALITVLDAAFGADATVHWAYGDGWWSDNFPLGNGVNLVPRAGPAYVNAGGSGGVAVRLPESVTALVSEAGSHHHRLVLNDYQYAVQATGVETPTQIRDALLALVVADGGAADEYTAIASGAASILVTPVEPGGLWRVRATPEITLTSVLDDQAYEVVRRNVVVEIEVRCFSKGRTLREGAARLAAIAKAAFATTSAVEILRRYGVALRGSGGAPVDLSSLDNGQWVTRNQYVIRVALQHVFTSPVGRIESADLTLVSFAPGGSPL